MLPEINAFTALCMSDADPQAGLNDCCNEVLHRLDKLDEIEQLLKNLADQNAALQKQLADLQFQYIDEVISSLHVHLMHNQTMEVILVQGPARKLQMIADEMTSRRGVTSGKMHLIAAVIPQVHVGGARQPQGAAI